jgi:hypothetical protein
MQSTIVANVAGPLVWRGSLTRLAPRRRGIDPLSGSLEIWAFRRVAKIVAGCGVRRLDSLLLAAPAAP